MKNNFAVPLFASLLICTCQTSMAAIVLSFSPSTGVNSLTNNATNQVISLYGYSTTGAITNVLGMNLQVVMTGPVGLKFMGPSSINGFTFTGISSVWDTPGFGPSVSGGIGGTTGGTLGVSDSIFTNVVTVSGNVGAPSLLGRFNIDTTGVFNSAATLSIDPGVNSFFLLDDASQEFISASHAFEIGGVAAVPEPCTTLLFGVCGVAFVARKLRRKTAVAA